MRYLAKFISADGLWKRQFVHECKPYYYRVISKLRSPVRIVNEDSVLEYWCPEYRVYYLIKKNKIKKDLVYLEYKEEKTNGEKI